MKLSIKQNLKKSMLIRNIYFLLQGTKLFLRFDTILLIKKYIWFFRQYKKFNNIEKNKRFNHTEFLPCLFDNLSYSPVEPTYFFQDSWAAKNIFKLNPKHHYDVGSLVNTIGILSQYIPTTMIDIRPIELELENLFFIKGSILDLPIEDNTLETISNSPSVLMVNCQNNNKVSLFTLCAIFLIVANSSSFKEKLDPSIFNSSIFLK